MLFSLPKLDVSYTHIIRIFTFGKQLYSFYVACVIEALFGFQDRLINVLSSYMDGKVLGLNFIYHSLFLIAMFC